MSKYIENKNPKYKRLLSLISDGEENARSMRELSRLYGVSERELRKMVELARTDGVIIASSDAGYFIPTCDEELIRYYTRVRFRINTATATLRPVEDIINEIIDDLQEKEDSDYEDE